MKKLFVVTLAVVLMSTLIFGGCAEPEPEPEPTPAPAPAPAPAPTEVIELRFATHIPPGGDYCQLYEEWAERVAEDTNDGVKITIYAGETLAKLVDIIPAIKSGIADIGELPLQGSPEYFPLNSLLNLSFRSLGDTEAAFQIRAELEDKFPEVKAEFKDFKKLFGAPRGSTEVHTVSVPVHLPEDLEGLKLVTMGACLQQVMTDIGASPLFLPPQDWYMSLERGLVEGIWMGWDGVYDMKLYEVTSYTTDFPSPPQYSLEWMLMNPDSWSKLPPDAQDVIDGLDPWVTEKLMQLQGELVVRAIAATKEAGVIFNQITPDEEKMWADAAEPAVEAQLANLEATGLPARAVYEEMLRLRDQYKK